MAGKPDVRINIKRDSILDGEPAIWVRWPHGRTSLHREVRINGYCRIIQYVMPGRTSAGRQQLIIEVPSIDDVEIIEHEDDVVLEEGEEP